MKISKEIQTIVLIIAVLLAIGGGLYITSTVKMDMGDFSGNGR